MKAFGGDNLGRPDLDAKYATGDVIKFLSKIGIDLGTYTPQPVIVFTNPKSVVTSDGSIIPALPETKLKEFIRKQVKQNGISPELVTRIKQNIGE